MIDPYKIPPPFVNLELMEDLPDHAQIAVQRILDRAAARLALQEADGDPTSTATSPDGHIGDHGGDQVPPLVKVQ